VKKPGTKRQTLHDHTYVESGKVELFETKSRMIDTKDYGRKEYRDVDQNI
jgi:hypothetical protein